MALVNGNLIEYHADDHLSLAGQRDYQAKNRDQHMELCEVKCHMLAAFQHGLASHKYGRCLVLKQISATRSLWTDVLGINIAAISQHNSLFATGDVAIAATHLSTTTREGRRVLSVTNFPGSRH